jgi:hypothetical protein
MPRFQAIPGIVSPAQREATERVKARKTMYFAGQDFIQPPRFAVESELLDTITNEPTASRKSIL